MPFVAERRELPGKRWSLIKRTGGLAPFRFESRVLDLLNLNKALPPVTQSHPLSKIFGCT